MLLPMRTMIAAVAALAAALLWDRVLYAGGIGEKLRVGWLVPLGEEGIKYLAATGLNASVPWVYALFGCGEGILETVLGNRHFDGRTMAVGILLHGGLGLLYVPAVPAWLSLIAAILLHIGWNRWILQRLWKRVKEK